MPNLLFKSLNIVLVLVTIGVFFYLGMNRVDHYLKMKAIDDCGKIMRYEKTTPSEGTQINIPVQDLYEKCIKDKGY